jgi:hypothetical protein
MKATHCLPSSLLAELQTELKNYNVLHSQALAAPSGRKFLLFSTEFYQAGQKKLVGGFADRLKGLISCALLAILTDRVFLVEWLSPVSLAEHFDAANIAWETIDALARIDENDLFIADAIDHENFSVFDQYVDNGASTGHLFGNRTLAKIHTNILSISNLLRKNTLLQMTPIGRSLARAVAEMEVPDLERQLVRVLFSYLLSYRPRRQALDMWNDFQGRRRDGPLIGVHFRSGGDGAWSDGAMDDVANASLVADTIAAVAEAEFENQATVLIASDSARFRADLKDLVLSAFPVISYDGEIYHYERSGGDPLAGSDFAIFEFICLSCCDYVIHGTGGFATMAALIGGRPNSQYSARIDVAELGLQSGTALLYPAAHARLEGLALGLWGHGVVNRIGGSAALISWQLACRPGSYEVWVRYAAAQERPMKLSLDGELVTEKALSETTGGWATGHQQWRFQVSVDLQRLTHTLELASTGPTPHIGALALVSRPDGDQRTASCDRGTFEPTPWSVSDHQGEDYLTVLKRLHLELRPKSYLEVGTQSGTSLRLAMCPSIAIDPNFAISSDVFGEKPICALFRMTSDDFFANHDPTKILGRPVDLAVLDGMHRCEFLLRDFANTERHCRRNSVIVLHDCIPVELSIAERNPGSAPFLSHRTGWWAGDVWRTLVILKKYRTELRMTALDAQPTGLICITNLSPMSKQLTDNYSDLVSEMMSISLQDIGFNEFFAMINLESTSVLSTSEQITSRFWL